MALHYREYGDRSAPLMMFVHGGGVSGWMWDKQIHYFSRYHCIVPDLPEHGLSSDGTLFSIRSSAVALNELIEEKARGKKVVAVGFSLGSQVIVQMLSLRPDLIDYAIINSALVRPVYAKNAIKLVVGLSFPLVKIRWFSKLQAKALELSEDDFEWYYEESRKVKRDALARVLGENMSFEIPENFRNANGKLLVTVGGKEKAIMKRSAKDIVQANANCSGVILPNIGHSAPISRPSFFNDMVEAWIHHGRLPEGCEGIV